MEKFKIMTVEDNELFSMIIDYMLEGNTNYEVLHVSSGEDCLRQLDFEPKIVVLDYALPGINGLEVLKKIKERSPKTKVIVLSGQQNVQVAADFIENGAIEYIQKDNNAIEKLVRYINLEREKISKSN